MPTDWTDAAKLLLRKFVRYDVALYDRPPTGRVIGYDPQPPGVLPAHWLIIEPLGGDEQIVRRMETVEQVPDTELENWTSNGVKS